MGGSVGSISIPEMLNRLGNLMISDLGAGLCILALGFALYSAMFGGAGGGNRAGYTVMAVVGFYGVGWALAEVTGTANPLGGSGIF